jgi:hypothetical protein
MDMRAHVPPDEEAIERNKEREPEGERIRAELIDWLTRNKIVSVMLDTAEHRVSVDIVKLPPRTKSVLGIWGSIRVRDDRL